MPPVLVMMSAHVVNMRRAALPIPSANARNACSTVVNSSTRGMRAVVLLLVERRFAVRFPGTTCRGSIAPPPPLPVVPTGSPFRLPIPRVVSWSWMGIPGLPGWGRSPSSAPFLSGSVMSAPFMCGGRSMVARNGPPGTTVPCHARPRHRLTSANDPISGHPSTPAIPRRTPVLRGVRRRRRHDRHRRVGARRERRATHVRARPPARVHARGYASDHTGRRRGGAPRARGARCFT